LIVVMLVGTAGNASFGQIIPASRCINWSRDIVGVLVASLPHDHYTNAATAGCDTNGLADCHQILHDICQNCPSNQVVYLPTGRYLLTNMVAITKSGISLRGAGMGKTVLIAVDSHMFQAVSARNDSVWKAESTGSPSMRTVFPSGSAKADA